jgi:hypothetical protein
MLQSEGEAEAGVPTAVILGEIATEVDVQRIPGTPYSLISEHSGLEMSMRSPVPFH